MNRLSLVQDKLNKASTAKDEDKLKEIYKLYANHEDAELKKLVADFEAKTKRLISFRSFRRDRCVLASTRDTSDFSEPAA